MIFCGMATTDDYRMKIELRTSGAPKYRVVVSLADRTVGEDYSCSVGQAEQIGNRMIQRHRQLVKESRLVYG